MRCPGPFDIERVQESQWNAREPAFLLEGVSPEDFRATRTARDSRFSDVDKGLLRMSFHSFVVRTPQGTLLVDTCVGNHKERRMLPEWHQQEFPYLDRLAQAGLTPADIDFVCCTHLHGDHVGWNTRLDNGRWVPTFPNARYLFADTEIAYWERLHEQEPANMYRQVWDDSVLPVLVSGQAERVDSEAEILSGVRLRPAPGHTPGNVVIELDDGKVCAVMTGDVVHHPVQIERPDWCSNFDDDQERARLTRRALLERLADTDTLMLPAHFAAPSAVRIVSETDGFFYAASE
jgi:glyoxylase-like metal-dependent hydrolase (beta-lactamase superfamily II)